MSSTIGTLFKVSTFGESHGKGVGAIVDGCPAQLELTEADLQVQLDRRRPGQSKLTTPRQESDRVTILSGVENGKTLGTPIGLFVPNQDQRPADYQAMAEIPRPSHADYTYRVKYGITSASGGGRASARETIGRVAAGAIAEKFLMQRYGVQIVAFVSSVGTITAGAVNLESPVSCGACPPVGAIPFLTNWKRAWRRPCSRCPQPRVLNSAPALPALPCGAPSTMTPLAPSKLR